MYTAVIMIEPVLLRVCHIVLNDSQTLYFLFFMAHHLVGS